VPEQTSIGVTEAAASALRRLRERHGALMLFQSGGCCDGSSPLCLHEGELIVGPNDLRLGDVAGVPFYIDREQYERWNRPRFVLDVADGATDAFTLEAGDGIHFVTRGESCASRPTDP
jgi:uncharacterized protein (DUF779 family)